MSVFYDHVMSEIKIIGEILKKTKGHAFALKRTTNQIRRGNTLYGLWYKF